MLHPSLGRTLAIQLSVLLIVAAQTYHGVIIQIQAHDFGISTLGIGIITSCFYLGYFISCLITRQFIAFLGYIRGHALMTTIYALATLMFPINPNVVSWSILYFVCGTAIGGMYVVFENWLNFSTDNQGRGQIMAAYMIMATVGKIIGNYAFNYVSTFSFSHYSYITMFILCSMLPLLTTQLQQPSPVITPFLSFKDIYRTSPAAFVVLFLSQIGASSTNGLGATFGKLLGLNSLNISHLMTLIFVAAIATQMPLGTLSNKTDRRLVILWVAFFLLVGNIMLLVVPIETPLFWLAIIIIGGSIYNFYPLAMAHFNDLMHEKHRASVTAQLLMVASVGQTIGPMTSSAFMSHLGYKGFAIVLIGETILILAFLLNRLRVRHPEKPDRVAINFIADIPLAPPLAQAQPAVAGRRRKIVNK
ncbi:MAG: MFS transporter [Alphaproteobacteria bacterium]|nr:MFS transporter [Alphaproteobacteria bacterium]